MYMLTAYKVSLYPVNNQFMRRSGFGGAQCYATASAHFHDPIFGRSEAASDPWQETLGKRPERGSKHCLAGRIVLLFADGVGTNEMMRSNRRIEDLRLALAGTDHRGRR
jgi:hypothetical protein